MSPTAPPAKGLTVEGLRVRHGSGPEVVRGVDLHARPGEVLALLGPNGAGKSTLLRALVGLLPASGSVAVRGRSLAALSAAERARTVAYVPQRTALRAPLSVRSVVDFGRFSHRDPWARPTTEDRRIVDQALEEAGVSALADRPFPTLSGGEQQRVLVARALATQAPVLLLDEPTSALDVRQVLLLHAVLRDRAAQGAVVVMVLHDLAEACTHADQAVLLHEGQVYSTGAVKDVVAPGPVRAVYGVYLEAGDGLGYRLPVPGETP